MGRPPGYLAHVSDTAHEDVQQRAAAGAEYEVSKAVRILAPVVSFAAAMVVRRILEGRYRRTVGGPIPDPKDFRVSFVRALIWSTATAALTTAIQAAVVRAVESRGAKIVEDSPATIAVEGPPEPDVARSP